MINRTKMAYIGAIGLPVLLLPLAAMFTIGGHSLMFISILSAPIGLIAALSYSDVKRQYKATAIVVRSTVALMVYALTFAFVVFISKANTSPFLINQGWVLILLTSPFLAAIVTEKIMLKSVQPNNNS